MGRGSNFVLQKPVSLFTMTTKEWDAIPQHWDDVQKFVEFEDACLEVCKGIIYDKNIFYPGENFTREQKAELKIEWLKQLGVWPIGFEMETMQAAINRAALIMEEKDKEIERLKDLISTAHAVGYQSGYKSGSNHDATEVTANKSWQQFKTENNL